MAGPQMQGFTEKGEPSEWDAAIGTVRGFRWWTVTVVFQSYQQATRSTRSYEWQHSLDNPWRTACYMPLLDKSDLVGMNSKSWKHGPWNGNVVGEPYEATCFAASSYDFGRRSALDRHPAPDPSCGCGFWAYWKPDMYSYASHPYVVESGLGNYTVNVPVTGCIEGSGRTIIGDKGFRTQRARITDLALHVPAGMLMQRARDHGYVYEADYGMPLSAYAAGGPVYMPPPAPPGPQYTDQNVLSFLSDLCSVSSSDVRNVLQNAVTRAVGDKVTWHEGFEGLKLLPRDKNYGGDSEVLEA